MAFIKLVGKTFAVRQKSEKTTKIFFRVGFVVYGIASAVMQCTLLIIIIESRYGFYAYFVFNIQAL